MDLTLTRRSVLTFATGRLTSQVPLYLRTPQVLDLELWPQRGKFVSMESLISHFRAASEG